MGFKNNDACLAKVSDDEPIFVFRAQDCTAHAIIEVWIAQHVTRLGANHPKIVEARAVADLMRAWPYRKMPD